MSPASQTVRRRQLGAALRKLREDSGKRIEDVAAHLECSMSKVSRVETGQAPIKARDLRDLLDWLGLDDPAQVEALIRVHRDAQQQGWWLQYDDLPAWLATYSDLESDAVALRAFEPMVVHGLLQTEDYMRAVIAARYPKYPPDDEHRVKFRLERQRAVTRLADPLELWVVQEEAALRRPVGGVDVMRAQLDHLAELATLPNVTVQVMPAAKGAHAALSGSFTVLDFGQVILPIVSADTTAGNIFVEKEREVRTFAQIFDLLRAAAQDPQETPALLGRIAREMQDS